MPNTLAHIGIQGLLTRTISKEIDLKWICLAAVIPDLPWVFRRIVRFLQPDFMPYDVKLYASVQSSLLFCIILSCACALLAKNIRQVFFVLVFGSLLHLLLDGLQTKWANGIHLFAPFAWQQVNYGVFWPNSLPTYALSLFGLVYFVFYWRKSRPVDSGLVLSHLPRTGLAALVLAGYFLLPVLFLGEAERTDSHYIGTLRNVDQRAGKRIELDRVVYHPAPINRVQTETGEFIRVQGIDETMPAVISLQGEFVNASEIVVNAYHTHASGVRDGLSYLGLSLVLLLWGTVLGRDVIYRIRKAMA